MSRSIDDAPFGGELIAGKPAANKLVKSKPLGGKPLGGSRKKTGGAGEDRAARYLEEKGFSIVARNWRTRTGEIDIVAALQNTLVFVEVKTLPHGNAELLSRLLDARKQKRIVETSKRFIQNNRKYNNSFIRYDVIVIDLPGFPELHHIENAFSEPL